MLAGRLGRLLDTFVAAQLRAASTNDPRLYHLRDEQGRRELDLLIETAGRKLIGIEVKAAATVTASDARHLTWLRDETAKLSPPESSFTPARTSSPSATGIIAHGYSDRPAGP